MRQGSAPGVESVLDRKVEQVGDTCRVNIGQPEEASRKVRRVVVSAEEAAKLAVEDVLHFAPQLVAFGYPLAH